jgi:glycosyltransferase involved in cell wall biosynthesis
MADLNHQFCAAAIDEGLWIVMAAYNEAGVIARILTELGRSYRNIVVVSDGSTDDTVNQAVNGGAVVLSHAINLGQGAALQTGIDYALSRGAELICTFDADGQHRVSDIAVMVEQLRKQQADIAFGSRFLGQAVDMPWGRRVVLKLGTVFNFLTTGIRMTDAHNGLSAEWDGSRVGNH